ncbi:hypothetical protein [Methanosarcina barkeri]|nr:hypothetical protein [Methanosarcina barkeri]
MVKRMETCGFWGKLADLGTASSGGSPLKSFSRGVTGLFTPGSDRADPVY